MHMRKGEEPADGQGKGSDKRKLILEGYADHILAYANLGNTDNTRKKIARAVDDVARYSTQSFDVLQTNKTYIATNDHIVVK